LPLPILFIKSCRHKWVPVNRLLSDADLTLMHEVAGVMHEVAGMIHNVAGVTHEMAEVINEVAGMSFCSNCTLR